MKLNFHVKEPDKAYISNSLWLPKRLVRPNVLKKALDFTVTAPERDDESGEIKYKQKTIHLWDESSSHIICPREFISTADYPNYKFPFVDLRPQFQRTEFDDLVVPRDDEQQRAWDSFAVNDNGILNLGCGKGKTRLAIKKIAQRKVPTLVVVPDGGILSQWQESIYGNPAEGKRPAIRFDGQLGLIQGPVFDWAHPITLALVTTLWMRIEQGAIPEEMFRYFGQIIWDEVHQIGAPKFSLTAPPWFGDRVGLTATVQREDGLDPIYRYHIGEPFYTDLVQDLVPRIYFQQTPTVLNIDTALFNDSNVSIVRSELGLNYAGNVFRYWSIQEALREGRKILCLSHSLDQLRLFHKLFPGSGLIIGETEKDERMRILRSNQITFAIAKLGSTGVDDDALDTLFWLTPFRSKINLQQSMGRIQRRKEGKKTPVMVVFEDWQTVMLRKLCLQLRANLRDWGYSFETFRPASFPLALPPEVQHEYDRLFRELEGERRARAVARLSQR